MTSCDKCYKRITDFKDINVVALLGVVPKSFCNDCYASRERGLLRGIYYPPKYPLNSWSFNISLIFATILLLVFSFILFITDSTPEFPSIVKYSLAVLMIIIVIFQWILLVIARNRVNAVKNGI